MRQNPLAALPGPGAKSNPGALAQAIRIGQAQQAACAADEIALAQLAQHAREGLGRHAQLGGDQALALAQLNGQRAGGFFISPGIGQQPFGAARLGGLAWPRG